MQVLVAEDDITSRTILAAILSKWGYDPLVVEDGSSAWEIMQKNDAPNLAVLDWDMPGMDGLEVCQRIRKACTSNPPYLIILTAKGEKADIVKGLDAGANDYISKPYDNDELQSRTSGSVDEWWNCKQSCLRQRTPWPTRPCTIH